MLTLTYYDFVYYSDAENKFFVSRNGCTLPGYIECIKLRQYWTSALSFDDYLKEKILLKVNAPESHNIWQDFQYNFEMTNDLYNYVHFFEKILYSVCRESIKEMITVCEFRHIFGMLFDDDHKTISLAEEVAIFERVQANLKERFPMF